MDLRNSQKSVHLVPTAQHTQTKPTEGKKMTKQKALELLNAAPGNDKVAKMLALDIGVMVDVMMALNPGMKMSDIAKWHGRVTS